MASAKLMIPKRSAPYYVLTANVTVHGKRVRRYGRFDFDPTVLKTHRQRENAAIEAALVFERAEQQKADDEKDGKNTPFRDAARAYIDSKKSMLDPSVRLEGDYEQHKNKANTTAGKETMLRRICEISPAFAEMPISKVNKRECEKFLDLLGEADVRSVKGHAVLKPNAKQYKKLSCPQIAAQCSIQTKSVERVFRGERTTLKTAQEIAAALKCKPEKLFHIELDHRPIARKTIKEYAIFLRLVMQYAEREYGIDNDTQTLAVKGTRSRPVDCLHPEEVEALFKVLPRCSTLEQVIVMGLLNTGMRRGELAGLTWEDIDFDHCTVHVDKSLLIVNKGYHLTTTKEDNVRDIDVAPEFMEYLKTYRDQWLAQKHRMGSAWQTCMDGKWESYRESLQKLRGKNFIVINDFGWPISPDHYGKIVDRVAEKAGIRKIHPHMFRHPYVKHTTKIFSLRLMDFQAQAYPDARRKTRGACQLHRGGQSRSPVRPLCNRKQFSCLLPQSKMSWILYAISMRLSGYTSTRSISSSASSVVSVSASKIALDASLRLSCRACSSCFFFACANTAA